MKTLTIKQILDNLPNNNKQFNITELEPELIKMGFTQSEIIKAKQEVKK